MAASGKNKVSVILSPDEFDRFDHYCSDKGFKKSTLLAKMIRELMEREGRPEELNLFNKEALADAAGQRLRG